MKLRRSFYLILLTSLFLGACSLSNDEDPGINVLSTSFDFNESKSGWEGDFADYKIVDSTLSELEFSYGSLPDNISNNKALALSGDNKGEHLFMFIKKKILGLTPNTEYTIVYDIEFASNAPYGSIEADSVSLKVGATASEPKRIIDEDYYRLNIDKGLGGIGGSDMVVIGKIGVENSTQTYDLTTKGNTISSAYPYFAVKTNSLGEVWLIIGTDSAYKGRTKIYYSKVNVILSASNY